MPSFVFMKILESTPERYDRGISLLSRGRIRDIYGMIADSAGGNDNKVLDIGCGTGNVSLACAARGSAVTGIDINAGMLEVAREKAKKSHLDARIRFLELGIAEMKSRFGEKTVDACVSCLAFGELTNDERSYALSAAHFILKPGGIIIIADEVTPRGRARRVVHKLSRALIGLLAYLLTQSVSRPVDDLAEKLQEASFVNVNIMRTWGDSFMIVKARKGA